MIPWTVSMLCMCFIRLTNDLQNIGVDVEEFRKVASWVSHQVRNNKYHFKYASLYAVSRILEFQSLVKIEKCEQR